MNTVRIDYFAVTVKDAPPERVLTDILLIPREPIATVSPTRSPESRTDFS